MEKCLDLSEHNACDADALNRLHSCVDVDLQNLQNVRHTIMSLPF